MLNRTIAVVGGLLLLLVAVGAVQVVAGLTDDGGDTAEAAFPEVTPYIEPTVTATPPQLPAEDVPGQDIADVPRYPESVRVAYGATASDSETVVELEYQTLDSLERVHAHVLGIVDTYGWSLTQEAFSGEERTFGLQREGESADIRLHVVNGRTVMAVAYRAVKEAEHEPTPEPEVVPEATSEPQPVDAPVENPAPAVEPDQNGGDAVEEPASEPEPEPEEEKSNNKPEKDDKDEPEEKPEKSKDESEKPENENKGPDSNNGNGNGPSENKGPDNNKDNGNGNKDKKD